MPTPASLTQPDSRFDGFGFRVSGVEFRVPSFGFRVPEVERMSRSFASPSEPDSTRVTLRDLASKLIILGVLFFVLWGV